MTHLSPYEHIARECTVTVTISADESAELFRAYDIGLEDLTAAQRYCIYSIIAKLKEQIWP